VEDFALTPAERALFAALTRREGLDRVDVVLTAHGLDAFDLEYSRTAEFEVDGVKLRTLTLERILASKRATKRPKDLAQVPALQATIAARPADKPKS
jgi:hypothetical protein